MYRWLLILIPLFTINCSCVYDPPQKGLEIFIHNQTSRFVYVTDSLPPSGYLTPYDTLLVNSNVFIMKEGNYIAEYDQMVYFFSKNRFDYLKAKKIHKLILFFIREEDIGKPNDQLRQEKGYKIFEVGIDEVWKNSINHIFYYGDSIHLSHNYDMTSFNRKID